MQDSNNQSAGQGDFAGLKIRIARSGEVLGDFTIEELLIKSQKSEIFPTDHAFVSKAGKWQRINEIPILKAKIFGVEDIPPPPTDDENDSADIAKTAPINAVPNFKKRRKIAAAIALSIFAIFGIYWLESDDTLDAQVFTVNQSPEWNQKLNGSIRNLNISIDRGDGMVTIKFDYDKNREALYKGIPRQFLVRFFDAQGNYITHFTTNERYVETNAEFPYEVLRLKSSSNELKYQISIPNAAFTKSAEFGFAM